MSAIMKELLTTDIGLMSIAVVAGVIIIGAYLGRLFVRNARKP